MNFKQRYSILLTLHASRLKVFMEDDSETRTRILQAKDEEIREFKELTKHTLDEAPCSLESFEEDDDTYTAEQWMSVGMRGCAFIPSDGSGYWATEDGYSWDHSDVWGSKPAWATHVAWFNQ